MLFAWLLACAFTANANNTSQELDESKKTESAESIKFQAILSDQYANFPVNWSPKATYRFALIRSPEEYDQVFQAAPTAGNKLPYAPDAELYEDDMIVVVSRVTRAPRNLDRALQIQEVRLNGATLEVSFKFQDGPKTASYRVKAAGVVRIPKCDVEKVVFYEVKERAGELDVANGIWLLPSAEENQDP